MNSCHIIKTSSNDFQTEACSCCFDKFQPADYQYIHKTSKSTPFTGKELDFETGYSYFGARYYDAGLSGLFFSVDPLADKYPNISPYAYCAWNPVKLVDPDGCELGDYYDTEGNYLGWDGNNDNIVYIVGNRNDIIKIKNNDREGRTTAVDDLQSVPLLKTTYGVLREACDVLDRAENNSGQTKEECSVVDFQSGLGVRSSTGESLKAVLPQTPDWIMDAVSIHLHNKYNDATQMSGHRDDLSGDADNFGDFIQNVIVGPLGVGGPSGLCFYSNKGLYQCFAKIVDRYRSDNMYILSWI